MYFSIDDKKFPYNSKGRAIAKISEGIDWNVSIVGQINIKYLCTTGNPIAKLMTENTRNGIQIEIIPKFLHAWDLGTVRKGLITYY